MSRYKSAFDIFFGVEHTMKKEDMEEQFNKEAKQEWRFAADAARITDENASSEDRKHRSGGEEEGAVESIPRNKGTCEGRYACFSVYSWNSECWSQRSETLMDAVVKQVRTTKHAWLIACDANVSPEDFSKILWLQG